MSPSPAAPSQGQTQGPTRAEGSLMRLALDHANDPVMGHVAERVESTARCCSLGDSQGATQG